MFNYIEKLRQKNDKVKNRIAFMVSFTFAGIIIFIWITAIYPNIQKQKEINDRISAIEPSPFSTFFSIFSQGSSVVNEQISKIKEASTSLLGGISSSTPVGVDAGLSTTTIATSTATTTLQ